MLVRARAQCTLTQVKISRHFARRKYRSAVGEFVRGVLVCQ